MTKRQTIDALDEFTKAYLVCALWSSNDNSTPSGGEPLDKNYEIVNIEWKSLRRMIEDCAKFQADHFLHIQEYLARAGHDFWLTRNRHGSGFWDGDWPDDVGKLLTDAAHGYGECDLMPERGMLYLT